jgi:hypothetical protein
VKNIAVWLSHNGAWDPSARELDVHRHRLRHRVSVIERLLGLDLSQFADRAELWAALQLADRSTGTSACTLERACTAELAPPCRRQYKSALDVTGRDCDARAQQSCKLPMKRLKEC